MTASISTGAARNKLQGLPPVLAVVAVIGVALLAWIWSAHAMLGMNGAPGVALGSLGWFLWFWMAMMAAMMLPSAWPMLLAHARMSFATTSNRRQGALACTLFVLGYLFAWTAYGLVAYFLYSAVAALQLDWLAWDRYGPQAAGLAVISVGLYQLTPLKKSCLKHCLTPSSFIINYWRPGAVGAFRMGAAHGMWCVGCCAGLMLLLFVLGIMSLVWMAIVTLLVFAEKIVPSRSMPKLVTAACIVLGAAVAIWPSAVTTIGANPGSASHAPMSSMSM